MVTILYPTIGLNAEEARILIQDPVHERRRASIALRPVNLLELDKLLTSHTTADLLRKQTAFAERLAFGKALQI